MSDVRVRKSEGCRQAFVFRILSLDRGVRALRLHPTPMSRIVFATHGSLGDLHPVLAMATEMRRRGHDIVIATSGGSNTGELVAYRLP